MKNLAFVVLTLVSFIFSGVASANLLTNGDFEALSHELGIENSIYLDELGIGDWDVYSSIPGWGTYDGAGIEIQRNTVVAAHSPDHYVELDSHGQDSNSGMVQYVWLTEGMYDLSFWYRPRTNEINDNGIEVLFAELGDPGTIFLTVDSISSEISDWVQYSVQLSATSESFWGIGFHASGIENTFGGFIDDVALNPVPEPATMLLLGTGLVGLVAARRKLNK